MHAVRKPVLGLVAVVIAVAVVVVVAGGGGNRHHLTIASQQARFIIPGLEVRVAGQVVGRVEDAEPTRQGTARVKVSIDDDAWPLPQGTRATFRWPGTIGFTNRYVELTPPARAAGALRDGATIRGDDITEAVEVDDIARLFDASGRRSLRATITTSGVALANAAPDLGPAIERAPVALENARALVQDLGADPEALDTLVRSTDRVVHAARAANPDVGQLVDGLDGTFRATADKADALASALGEAPATLTTVRGTLAHAGGTLDRADALLVRLAPGVTQLRRAATPLSGVVSRVLDVAPNAQATVATLRRASPDLRRLLTAARTVAPKLTDTAKQAEPQLVCLRPYAPEVAGFATTWNGFLGRGDGTDHYARANAAFYPFQEGMGLTSADVAKTFPGLHYAFPRPPGEIANQPWFNDACGVGRDTVDPAKDPEIDK